MKRIIFLLLSVCCIVVSAQERRAFELRESSIVQEVNRTFTTSSIFKPWNSRTTIGALGIDAEVSLHGDNALVRVFLESEAGDLYLILESNPMLTENYRKNVVRYAEETADLGSVIPKQLKIVIKDATLRINRLHVSPEIPFSRRLSKKSLVERRKQQVDEKVVSINAYNKRQKKLWRAKCTDIALLPFVERQRMMGLSEKDDSYGFEYYGGGIFDFSYGSSRKGFSEDVNSPYVKEFDWRNRHGRDWITPPKKQEGQSCWSFATCGLLESYFNLYYNELYELDLSELELVLKLKQGKNDPYYVDSTLLHIQKNSIVDELCYPYAHPDYVNYTICDNPYLKINMGSYYSVNGYEKSISRLKKDLIHAPVILNLFWAGKSGHSVLLTSYRLLEKGDVVVLDAYNHIPENVEYDTITNDYANKTLWTVKNSYGTSWGENGYANLIFDNIKSWRYYGLNGWIKNTTGITFEHRIADEDNDGFYTWGFGERPDNLPPWAELLQDGDDSNAFLGPMDVYGHCQLLAPQEQDTLYIDSDTIWKGYKYLYQHLVIRNGATLTIQCETKVHPDVTITVFDGCTLNLMNTVLKYPKIETIGSGQVNLEGAVIELSSDIPSYLNLNNQ